MLALYHNNHSTSSQKVRIVLAEKGLTWTDRHVDLAAGEHHRKDYLRLNPAGEVPILVDDGAVIPESNVINEYLDDRWPNPALRPPDPLGRARMRLWTRRLDDGLHAAIGAVTMACAVRHQYLALDQDELARKLAAIPDPDRRERFRINIESGTDSPLLTDAVRRYDRLFAAMETDLAKAPWLAGKDYSLADAAFTPYLARFDQLGLSGLWAERPRLGDWFARATARPSFETEIAARLASAFRDLLAEKGSQAWPAVAAIVRAK